MLTPAQISGARTPAGQRGFNLIELMVVIAVLAAIVVLSVPSFGDWILNAQIRTAAESITTGLQTARNEAVRRNTYVEFHFPTVGNSGWEVRLPDLPINAALNRSIEARPAAEGSAQVVTTVTPENAQTLTFDGSGRRWGPGAGGVNTDASQQVDRICVNLPVSVLAAEKSRNLEIDVSLSGDIRMCDPAVSQTTDSRYCPGYPTVCRDFVPAAP